jgi:hypothetical protein
MHCSTDTGTNSMAGEFGATSSRGLRHSYSLCERMVLRADEPSSLARPSRRAGELRGEHNESSGFVRARVRGSADYFWDISHSATCT